MTELNHLERKLKRESAARKEAEKLLENKSLELYQLNQQLQLAMEQLEKRSEQHIRKLEFEEHIDKVLISFGRSFLEKKLSEVQLHTLVRKIAYNPVVLDVLLHINVEVFDSLSTSGYGNLKLKGCENQYCKFSCWDGERLFLPIMYEGKQAAGFVFQVDTSEVDQETILNKLTMIGELIRVALIRSLMWQREIELRVRAEESERATKEFVAMINHELRTPLNGVLGSVDLIQRTSLSDEQQNYFSNLVHGGELLRVIINDLLDFSKMNAGMMEIIPKHFRWTNLEESIRGIFAPKASDTGVQFEVITENIPDVLYGDLDRVKQILVNLIGNAFKFTESGQVTLKARWSEDRLAFDVIDTGIGIPESAKSSLFDPFVQVDRSSKRTHEGSGLGLAICKNLTSLMNGKIECESELGIGTVFKVHLNIPQGVEALCADGAMESDTSDIEWSKLKILVVDDASLNQVIVKEMLGKIGVAPDTCWNGIEAIHAVNSSDYDLVFMDCRMPEMDGFQATRELREQGHEIPIVALTAATTLEEREKCIESGMSDILVKPYTADELKQTIVDWVKDSA
ncbi:response regulator [Vibrio sp. HN007]|uniref:response regulator n=1 Tax=Vibrio iocasae TaxID=3098914 RepID=UPI0035D3EEA1